MTDLDYAPDFSPHTPGIITSLTDFYPTIAGAYATCLGPVLEGYATITGDVIGSAVVKNKSGSSLLYAGTTTKLYQANGTTGWTDRSGATYASTGSWDLVQFGDTTIAASGGDVLQKSTGGAFSDVSTAPAAKLITIHENAIVAANLSTDTAGWARSDTGSTSFTVTAANDADSGTLLNGSGPITALTTFQNLAVAWKGDWMYGGRFVGDIDEKIRWDTLAPGIGCVGQHAHIQTEAGLIFVSNRDILLFDGSVPRSIADKIRKTFLSTLSPTQKSNILITHNEIERNVYIWIPTVSTYPAAAFIYNYRTGKWGFRSAISGIVSAGIFTYLRARVVNSNYPDYLAVGGISSNTGFEANVLWAHGSSGGQLINFAPSGGSTTSGTSTMTLGYWGDPNVDMRLTGARIVYEGTPNNALSVCSANTYNSTLSTSTFKIGAVDPDGNANINVEGRFHKPIFTWQSQAAGVQSTVRAIIPRAEQAGKR